jgi:hypothetical protein
MNAPTLLTLILALTTHSTSAVDDPTPVYYINVRGETPAVACNYLNFIGHYPKYEDFKYRFLEKGVQVNGTNIIENTKAKNPRTNRSNSVDTQYDSCKSDALKKKSLDQDDLDRDEFPFNALVEGGGWKEKILTPDLYKPEPSVRCISAKENKSDGANFRHFIAAQGIWRHVDYYREDYMPREPIIPSKPSAPGTPFKIRVHPNNMPDIKECLKLKPPPTLGSKEKRKTDVNRYGYAIQRKLEIDALAKQLDQLEIGNKILRKSKSTPNLTPVRETPTFSLRRTKSNRKLRMATEEEKKTDNARWDQLISPKLKTITFKQKATVKELELGLDNESKKSAENIRRFRMILRN